jgi:hypothetical protein
MSGALSHLESLFTGDETARTMIVSPEILAAVTPPFSDDDKGRRLGEFRAWLDAFLEGAEVSVAEDPFNKPADAMLARVAPVKEGFWSIRVTDPNDTPGIRCFGGFGGKDQFIALTWEYREAIQDFSQEIGSIRDAWTDIFADDRPFSGENLDDYLTNYRTV